MMNRKNKTNLSRLRQWKMIVIGCMLLTFGLPETALSETVKGTVNGTQQTKGNTVTGTVLDENGEPIPGATVIVKGTTRGVITDSDGTFAIQATPENQLEISYLGYQILTVPVGKQTYINVALTPNVNELDEVTVVAFATQKKESVIASVTTVSMKELKVPSSNLTTALAGRIAGLISYQRTGEPGADNAQFFIRGVTTFGTGRTNPLILIDGVEMTTDDLARLTTDDIASFSIMKDANATALYGARGANGVILVTTKEGSEGKTKIQFRAEGSYSSPTETMEYADPVTYMRLYNEATRTRDPMASLLYSSSKITNTEKGNNPLRYPAVDWQKMLFNDHTFNQRYNLNVSGGGKIARYYVAASYSKDNGIIKMDRRNNFNNNIQIDRYVLRSNVNINLTPITEMIVRLHGAFDDYSGPLDGGSDLYNKAMNANPALFQPYYEPGEKQKGVKHILFGNYETGNHLNPYAEMVKGFRTSDRTDMLAQFELKQNLNFITEGLSARALFNVNRYSLLDLRQSYIPFFYRLEYTEALDSDALIAINPDSGRETLELLSTDRSLTSSMYFEGVLQYNRTFADKHNLSGLLVYTLRESLDGSPSNLQASLPNRNLGLSGRLTYGYTNRYFIEANFGYNGSERFAESERFGFFPSIGGGWILTNEKFMEPFKKTLSLFKLKATYGLVGNDAIGDLNTRFFYLANVNVDAGTGSGYTLGERFSYTRNGVSISRYADPNITWEVSRKTNIGIEVGLWNSLELQMDWFHENRSKILQSRSFIPASMGLQATPSSNIGKAHGSGVDISLDYSKSFGKDFWTVFRSNFTYAVSKYDVFEEPDYSEVAPWRSHKGQKISQQWGYVAERLFTDDEEVKNAPTQFGRYGAGDIKYKDINGDMIIDDNDQVPIGLPATPEINYGFGISMGYKNLDLSCFFQGSARSSFWIDADATAPFIGDRALLKYWADDHWSEDDRNIHAQWPRLSTSIISNNIQRSTWFMQDGTFLRLKTAEIGYTLPKKWSSSIRMQNARIYASGSNLWLWSAFKMWDVEMAGNGLAYPLQRVFNIGINVEF
jgi:TonB-linked SusC/RagA family outer membrane protein